MSCCFGVRRRSKSSKNKSEVVGSNKEFKDNHKSQIKVQENPKQKDVNEDELLRSLVKKVEDSRMGSTVLAHDKGADYAIQNNDANSLDLKANTKLLQLKFYDEDDIIETPTINTFRYDSILSHVFTTGRDRNNSNY